MTRTGSRANERGQWVLLNAAGPPRWSYPTCPPSIQSELFYTDLEKRLLKIRQKYFLFPPLSARFCARVYTQGAQTHRWGSFHSVGSRQEYLMELIHGEVRRTPEHRTLHHSIDDRN
jgi:hypothetical protein